MRFGNPFGKLLVLAKYTTTGCDDKAALDVGFGMKEGILGLKEGIN